MLQPFTQNEFYEEEIGDGNLNNVTRLYTRSGDGTVDHTIIIKQSMPYIKCLGENFPLGVERMDIEYNALLKFDELAPGSVPRPVFYHKPTHSVCMEDLRGYEILRQRLIRGEFNLEISSVVARNLAVVHRETHRAKMGADALAEIDKTFENSNMLSLTEKFIFTRPFNKNDETNRCSDSVKERLDTVYEDQDVLQAAKKMLKIFLEKKECLVHGDLHTGSILVGGSDARIMDMEFAFIGPAAFDLGLLIANYIFSYHRHISIPENNDERRKFAYLMIDACKSTIETYLSVMTAPVDDRQAYEANLLSETAGFAGCEIIRRLVGAAHNEDLEGMGFAEQDCLGAGVRLLQAADRIHTIDRLMVIALMLT